MKIGSRVKVLGFSTQGVDFDGLIGVIVREVRGLFVVQLEDGKCQCFKKSQLRKTPQKRQSSI